MSIITLTQVGHDFGNKLLFDNITLTLDNNTRAGLIGRNGTGKTTLFKIMTGELKPYKGTVSVAKGYKVGYFSQDFNFSSQERLWNWLYQSREDLIKKKEELQLINNRLHENPFSEKETQNLAILQSEYEALGGFHYENEIKTLLARFSFTEKDYDRVIDEFSGGEKTRIRLISILLNKYNFILFDEPTNHLDLVTVDWFIKYLKTLECGYLIVSHDRYLLDQVAQKIYELNNKKIDTYSGNYSSYEQQSLERTNLLEKHYSQQQKLIKKTEDFIKMNITRASTSNRAKSRLKMLNKLDRIELASKAKDLKINIDSSHRSGNDIFRLLNMQIGYKINDINGKQTDSTLIYADSLHLHYQDKICLVGANGTGKTTLLKVLNGEYEPLSGELWTGYNLSVGYYDQMQIELDEDLTVLETIWNLVPGETFGYVMKYLARFGFTDSYIDQKVYNLSGGEKSRLFLATLIHEKPNLLILDEPTNHLDISMIKTLEEALKNYDGTVILVSHDRYFIQNITNDYWVIKDKKINHYKDSFENILEQISPYEKEKKIKQKQIIETNDKKIKKTNPYILNKILEQISAIETSIKNKEDDINRIHSKFSDSDFYTDKLNIEKANKDISKIKSEILDLNQQKDDLETEYLNYV